MMYVRYPLSLRQVEDLLSERGIEICHEMVRFWWCRLMTICPSDQEAWRYRSHLASKATSVV